MLAFIRNAKATGDQDPWPPLSFQEGRVLWRDSTALFQAANEDRSRPENLQWLDDLALDGYLDGRLVLPVDVLGLRTDRAKVLFWRHERLPLPLEYLHNSALIAVLKSALSDAEDAAKALREAVRKLADLLLAPHSDESGGRRANKDDVHTLIESLGVERSFWPGLEPHFRHLLTTLPQDATGNDNESGYGDREIPKWRQSVWRAATEAFDRARDTLAPNLRSHKAIAKAEVAFYSKRKAAFGTLEPSEVKQ
jgi:CRISPR type I-E-associated protein CasA/Cse1